MLISNRTALTHGSDFEHDPLPHPITHVRLLEVLPLIYAQDDAVRCRLRSVRLTDYNECYTALSYTWSHSNTGHPIFVNDREVNVRENLYEFLRLYRQKLALHALPTVFLWIDALCLDYDNVRERNSQVQIMPNIFQRAKTVLAWLEPIPGVTEISDGRLRLPEFVDFLGQIKVDLDQHQNYHNDRQLATKYLPGVSSAVSHQYVNEWETMLQICRHRYWSRLWVLQENRFAQNLMFMYGDTLWSWTDFRAPFVLMWYMTENGLHNTSRAQAFDPAQVLYSPAADVVKTRLMFEPASKFSYTRAGSAANRKYSEAATERWHLLSTREPLSDLLKMHRHRSCSERVDKVYALIGMSDSDLTVDYERSNIELFCSVLLSLKVSLELNFVSMLAHHLDVSAFQYQQNRRSLIKDVPSILPDQSATDIVGHSCHTIYSVRPIPARTEISDILQARLGIQKLNYFRITAQQDIGRMTDWDGFPPSNIDMPRVHGHKPGTQMPIVDGFDLSETSFRAVLFLNSSTRNRKAMFGMISFDDVQAGDVLVVDEKMHAAIVIRISGLSRTWLTVVGVVLFARRVTVESEFSSPLRPLSRASTTRSTTLSDFCEQTLPTPFTISGCDNRENFILKPYSIQLQSLVGGSGLSSSRHSRSSSKNTNVTNTTNTTMSSYFKKNEKRWTSKSDKIERILEVISLQKRHSS